MRKSSITLLVTYNATLANINETIEKHWHILNTNLDCREMFEAPPIIAFAKNVSLEQGTSNIKLNKKYLTVANYFSKGEYSHCYSISTICYKQVNTTSTLTSNQINQIFDIYVSLNCKNKYVVDLFECSICKIEYKGKSETQFHPFNTDQFIYT